MSDAQTEARAIVDAIFTDLRDRSFLKWMFDERGDENLIARLEGGEELRGLDLDVQEEIRAAWSDIIATALAANDAELAVVKSKCQALDDECQQSMLDISRERDRAERAEAELAELREADGNFWEAIARAERAEAQLAEAQEELAVLRANQIAHVEVRAKLSAQLAEANKALDEIDVEARSFPVHTHEATRETVIASKLTIIRSIARRAREQGGENG